MIATASHNALDQTVNSSGEPPHTEPLHTEPASTWNRRTLRRGQSGLIGIDVGSRYLKIAQVDFRGGVFHLRGARLIELEQTPGGAGHVEEWSLGSLVREAVGSTEFHGRRIACVLPNSCYQETSVDIEPTPDRPVEETARGHVSQTGSLGESGSAVDFWKIPLPPSSGACSRESYRMVRVSESVVKKVGMDFQKAGFHLHCVDGPAMARARCTRIQDPLASQDNLAVLDWGYSLATLTFIVQGIPVFSRALRDCSYSRLLQVTARELGMTQSNTDVLLRQYGLPGVEPPPRGRELIRQTILDTLRPAIHQMGDELQRTMAYLERKFPRCRPERLLLTGGGAALNNGAHWLSRISGLKAHCWSPSCLRQTERFGCSPALFAGAVALSALTCPLFRE